MFALLLSSRPLLTPPTAQSPTHYTFTIPSTPTFSHIAICLLPDTILPPNTAAGVYIQLPGSQEFKFLGAIGNEKQSAIFKVRLPGAGTGGGGIGGDEDAMIDDATAGGNPNETVTIGISIEPAAQIAAALAQLQKPTENTIAQGNKTTTTSGMELVPHGSANPVSTKVLAQRIIKNAYDFLASFGTDVVPLKAFQGWWDKFEKKIENDPGFLERSDGG